MVAQLESIRYTGVDTLDEPITTTIVRVHYCHPRTLDERVRDRDATFSQSIRNLFKCYTHLEEVQPVKS